jgi:hypothetical protein
LLHPEVDTADGRRNGAVPQAREHEDIPEEVSVGTDL